MHKRKRLIVGGKEKNRGQKRTWERLAVDSGMRTGRGRVRDGGEAERSGEGEAV